MAHTRLTLALDEGWDLHLDESGDIALAGGAAATAQNVSNECRLFTRDAYIAYDKGIPHWILELGSKSPPKALLAALMRRAALGVPDVARVLEVELEAFDPESRRATGTMRLTTAEGGDALAHL